MQKASMIMKTLKLNLALVAILLGTGAAVASTNPFSRLDRYYYYDSQWNENAPSSLTCQPTDITKICSGEFESQPTTDNSVSNNPGVGAATLGVYQ
jgi:hypothetical protein